MISSISTNRRKFRARTARILALAAGLACAGGAQATVISVKFVVSYATPDLPCSGDTTLAAGPMKNADGNIFTGQLGPWNGLNIADRHGFWGA